MAPDAGFEPATHESTAIKCNNINNLTPLQHSHLNSFKTT